MASPKEKGQRIEGVHHSEVSESLYRRADEGERMGGREKQKDIFFIFVWLLVLSQKFVMAYRVGLHPLCAN